MGMSDRKKVIWKEEYGVHMLFCPYCEELVYEVERCIFCGKPYRYAKSDFHPTVVEHGDYVITQTSNFHVWVEKDGQTLRHASCTRKLTKEELITLAEDMEMAEETIAEMRAKYFSVELGGSDEEEE